MSHSQQRNNFQHLDENQWTRQLKHPEVCKHINGPSLHLCCSERSHPENVEQCTLYRKSIRANNFEHQEERRKTIDKVQLKQSHQSHTPSKQRKLVQTTSSILRSVENQSTVQLKVLDFTGSAAAFATCFFANGPILRTKTNPKRCNPSQPRKFVQTNSSILRKCRILRRRCNSSLLKSASPAVLLFFGFATSRTRHALATIRILINLKSKRLQHRNQQHYKKTTSIYFEKECIENQPIKKP
jgi:hypothetical protein